MARDLAEAQGHERIAIETRDADTPLSELGVRQPETRWREMPGAVQRAWPRGAARVEVAGPSVARPNRMQIRPAAAADADAIAAIFRAVIAGGDTYSFAPDTDPAVGVAYFAPEASGHVASDHEGRVLGMYRLVPNQRDLGAHVANASYMVSPAAHGRGIGAALGRHSIEAAQALGYRAMQFNYVVSTNQPAVQLWQKLGFRIVGTSPQAFRHATLGYVDTYVMHRWLVPPPDVAA